MCGIIGYCGNEDSVVRLIDGLKALEYRGYDSAGVSLFAEDGILTVKASGRIANIEKRLADEHSGVHAECGIGHTRWATTGKPNDINSHPHNSGKVSIVHNGIIENYKELKRACEQQGVVFASETDSEVIAALINLKYTETGDVMQSLRWTMAQLTGSYAVAALFADREKHVFAFRHDNPLIAAATADGNYLASDFAAVSKYTDRYYLPEDGDIVEMTADYIKFFDADGNEKQIEPVVVTDMNRADGKQGYPHYMLKEIHEVPRAIRDTCKDHIYENLPTFDKELTEKLAGAGRIYIIACGTALNAGKLGKTYFEKYAGIPVSCETASEFRYVPPILNENDRFIFISQSGETADTAASLRMVKARGLYTIAVVNTPNSTIAREADNVIYTRAGTETAVASTKAYNAQASLLFILALGAALEKGTVSEETAAALADKLVNQLPEAVETILADTEKIKALSEKYCTAHSCFFIGRGPDFYLAEESSLKLKEISYIHCEAYAAGELKHGTIALIEPDVPVISIISGDKIRSKTINNAAEVKAREAKVLMVTDRDTDEAEHTADDVYVIHCPDSDLFHICAAVFFQLFAYHTALGKGWDVDKPRNLAKSVTVE